MRKSVLFTALVVAMSAVSCVQDINDDAPVNNDGVKTFEASFGAMGKAVLEPGETESKVAWEVNDQVSVLAGGENYLYTAASAGYSTKLSTEATDVPSEGTFYAVYPYDNAAALADGKISTTLPAEQTAVLGSFSTHLAVAQTTGSTLAFKNVCGLVKVTVSDAEVTKVEFKGNTNEIVAGGVSVTVTDTPAWTATETGSQVVTLVPAGEAATLAKGVYYLAVLPQTFEGGITVTAYKGDEAWDVRKVETPVTVERSDIKGSNSFGVEGSGTEADPYILDAAQDLVEMRNLATLGGETWFKMVKDIDMKGITDYIPVNYNDNYNRKINFDGGNFTISNLDLNKSRDGGNYTSLFGVLYGSVKNLKVDKATIVSSNGCGVIGGYVGTSGKPALVENVHITNSSVTCSGSPVGGVAGTAREAEFINVSYQGSVKSTYPTLNANNQNQSALAGGFAGQTMSTNEFKRCSVDVVVDALADDVAGFVGKVAGTVTITDCINNKVKVTTAGRRCGGFIGWNASTITTITNCSVVKSSEIKSTVAQASIGGFIGFGDAASTKLVVDGCSSDVTISAGATGNVGGFIGYVGYASDITIKNSYSAGSVTTTGTRVGGFVGYFEGEQKLLIEKCYSTVTVQGAGSSGGFIGSMAQSGTKESTIRKCYATGNLTAKANYTGGFVGYINSSNPNLKIENCYAHGNISGSGTQRSGGFIACVEKNVTVNCCYSKGNMGPLGPMAGGFIGAARNWPTSHADYDDEADLNITVTNSIAWPSNVTSSANSGQWSSSPMIGVSSLVNTYTNLYYNPDVVVTDPYFTEKWSHPDVSPTAPITAEFGGIGQWNSKYNCYLASSYCGRPAPAGSTISSVAKTLGWSSDIWDFSEDVPTLK